MVGFFVLIGSSAISILSFFVVMFKKCRIEVAKTRYTESHSMLLLGTIRIINKL